MDGAKSPRASPGHGTPVATCTGHENALRIRPGLPAARHLPSDPPRPAPRLGGGDRRADDAGHGRTGRADAGAVLAGALRGRARHGVAERRRRRLVLALTAGPDPPGPSVPLPAP